MSFKVLIVPEDPIYNGFILKPLGERLLREVGKGSAKVEVLTNPKLSGYNHAKDQLEEICERYRHFDLILFLPDRDGSDGRDSSLEHLTQKLQKKKYPFVALAAKEEVEAWLLAGHKNKLSVSWSEIRNDRDVKESVFEPFINQYGDDGPGGGRERLMRETLKNFASLMQSCPELETLKNKVSKIVNG